MKNSKKFSSILSDIKHAGKKLHIGMYQRPISWSQNTTYNFVNDAKLSENDKDNNYGAVYLYERNDKFTDVVEGQQRFVTFFATLCAIKNFIEFKSLDKNEEMNIIKKYISEILTTPNGYPLIETSGTDLIDIETIMDNNTEQMKIDKNHKLISNYNKILTFIKEMYKLEGIDGIKSFYYNGMMKASVLLDFCETEEEVLKLFERLNRPTESPTSGDNICSHLYDLITNSKDYSDTEKVRLFGVTKAIKYDGLKDLFYTNFLYFKTGKRVSVKKALNPFKKMVAREIEKNVEVRTLVNEIDFIFNLQKSIWNCNVHSGRYSDYDNKKLSSVLKVFCDPKVCENIMPILTDFLVYSKETIPMDDIIDMIKMLCFTQLRATIVGYSSHLVDGFIDGDSIIRRVLNNKTDSNTYQELLYSYLSEINTSFLKQYSNEEIIYKMNNGFNLYSSKFRDSILNILNNYKSKGELQDLFDGCNIVQREHIKCKDEFSKNDSIKDSLGNITVIVAKDNMSNQNKPFIEKIDTFKSSNFNINKNISEYTKWEIEEIKKETNRRAKIIAEFTNPANFCKKRNKEITISENLVTSDVVYTEAN